MSDHATESHAAHGSSIGTYVMVISVLTIATAMEVGIIWPSVKAWYLVAYPSFANIVMPVVLIIMAMKFWAVVYFFMHLRQDHGMPRLVFAFPLGLAFLMILVLMLLNGHNVLGL